MFDTFVLQEALAAVIRGEADEAVLDEYARERRRVFLEVISPAAVENKRLIFHSSDPERLRRDWAVLRRLESDEEAARERLLFTSRWRRVPDRGLVTASRRPAPPGCPGVRWWAGRSRLGCRRRPGRRRRS
jgi:3-(3-hydroxy-phenyl)propionate hydroxylase/6-hydroxy-3-succinoylpyridine 3-monooxygenase